ncbi:DNA invertase Pin-like site-specific DNA recombinase [Arthrobacter stackebrandtii]|uniref:DNA invertase Pin-like site-specific DNA recombinase n=1 Tax=Arthrobacter stackebrandtii TaxID=272161 RepID=A0ABS4YYX8_9MICC|nr:recombinase family protein [Arthrobacter stackebrandtii]MBP2413775.1 DNA invertase Pin-like site-specific DNA recombinase [Arthrobacter stackebrandtii]PYH00362.1 recombinase family protein [Arthrobacter stackebrandtii]
MGTRAFIYCRISQDRTGAGLGVQRQEEDCRELAARLGLAVARVFVDNDVSAYSGRPRPGYRDMLARLRKGDADYVLCWHTDRLHRRPVELEDYIDVCEQNGVTTHTVKAGELDLSTPSGRMVARMLGSAARYESEHKAERAKRKMRELTSKGKYTGGQRPFGWTITDKVPSLHPEEAHAVRELFGQALEGRSLGAMARWLNGQGLRSTMGNEFGAQTVRALLLRPRNAGLATQDGEISGPSEFPAIVSEDVYRAARSLLTDPKRGRFYSIKPKYLLTGIAQCHCGSKVITGYVRSGKRAPYPVYRCPVRGIGHVGKRVDYVDDYVNTVIVMYRNWLSKQERAGDSTEEARYLETEVLALRERLTEAATMAATGTITMMQLATMSETIQARLQSTEDRLTELALMQNLPALPQLDYTKDVEATELMAWLELPIDDRRDYARQVCNVVLLSHFKGTARVFDRDTVQVVLKNKSSARGLLTVEELDQLKQQWRDSGILPATDTRTFNNHRPGGDGPILVQ